MIRAAAVSVWTFLFIGLFGTALPAFDAQVRVVAIILYGAPLVAWASFRLRGPRDVLDVAILVGLGLSLVVSLASADVVGSLEASAMAVAFALLFWAAREVAGVPAIRSAVAVGVAAALVAWLLIAASTWLGEKVAWVAAGGGIPPLESSRIFGWSSPNTFPVLALLAVPFVTAVRPPFVRRLLLVLLAGSAVVVLPFSLGRAGYVGIAAALVAYELLRGAPLLRRAWRSVPAGTAGRATAVLVLAAALVAGLAVGGEVLEGILASRVRIWAQALSIFAADPLTGGGPSTFHWLRLAHTPDYGDRIPVYLAHNVLVQTLADGGLLLVSALALMLVAFGVVVARRRGWEDSWTRLTFAVLVGYAAASMFDDFSTFPAVTAMVVALGGAAAGAPVPESRAVAARYRWLAPAAVAMFALATLPAVVAVGTARLAAEDARRAAVSGDWSGAAEAFERAIAAHPVDAGYHLARGLALAELDQSEAARAAYERARTLSPGDPRPYGALAALDDAGDPTLLLDLAARRTVRDPQYAYRLGQLRANAGDTVAAADAFALAVAVEPRLFDSLPSTVDGAAVAHHVEELLAEFEAQSDVIGHSVRWDVALARSELPAAAPPAWQAVAEAASGWGESGLAAAERAVSEQPYDPRSYRALAFAAAAACDSRAAERADRLLALLSAAETAGAAAIVTEGWDPAYREEGLGDYQPTAGIELPSLAPWPLALVGSPPGCG